MIESESVGEEEKKKVVSDEEVLYTGGARKLVSAAARDWVGAARTCESMRDHARTGKNKPKANKWLCAAASAYPWPPYEVITAMSS